jgi:hypothetical protein
MAATEAKRLLRIARRDLRMARRLLDRITWSQRAEALIDHVHSLLR